MVEQLLRRVHVSQSEITPSNLEAERAVEYRLALRKEGDDSLLTNAGLTKSRHKSDELKRLLQAVTDDQISVLEFVSHLDTIEAWGISTSCCRPKQLPVVSRTYNMSIGT